MISKKYFILIIILILITKVKLLSQNTEFYFSHITAEDGISTNGVTKIFQDSRGFIWFGTYNGLNRYDGYNFKIFLPEQENPTSISNHSISSIVEDKDGNLWVATIDGLNKYKRKTEEFIVYKNNPDDPNSISNNNVITLFIDREGTLWVGTLNGLNKYNKEKDNFTVIKKVSDRLNPDSLNSVVCIEEDSKGNLWLGTWNGLTCMTKDGKVIKQIFAQPPDYKYFDYRIVSSLLIDNSNNLWIGLSNKGIAKYNLLNEKIKFYKSIKNNSSTLTDDHVNTIFKDRENNIWIGTKNGLNKYLPLSDNFVRILHDPNKTYSIIDNNILSLTQDNTGIIWIGTGGGVSKTFFPKNNFHFISNNISNRLTSIFINKNNDIWLGSLDGLYKLEKSGITHFQNNPNNSNSISDNFIMSVYEDSDGYIWIGTNHSGLNRYDPKTKKFKLFTYDINDNTSISNNGITSICEDRHGNLWFSTWWGLNKYNKKTEKFYRYLHDNNNPNSLPYDLVWVVFEDSRGMIWVGTDGGGAGMLNPKTNKFINFTKSSLASLRISENRVFAIFESSDGIIWFGTSDGLSYYDYKTNKTKIYKTKDGLPGNIINGIIEDNNGNIWITSDKGLAKFDRKTNTFYNYTKRNGLPAQEFSQNLTAKSKNGYLYFSCGGGLLYFNPDSIKEQYLNAPIVFTDLKIYNESVPIGKNNSILKESITEAKSITIPPGNDVITIEFALLDFYNVKKNRYSYKLEGFDMNWNDVGNRNFATYTNLPPGEYKFIVKAYNIDGIRDARQATLNIIILPAFYQTALFKFLSAAALILMVALYINFRTRNVRKQNKILEEKILERTKDLDETIKKLSNEIEERIKAEEKLKISLLEKEILLKEIHHRVKNNLQVVSSLLFLQSINLKDENVINAFKESRDRIKCMALIHEKLYRSENLSMISFEDYIKSLVDELKKSFVRKDKNIITVIEAKDINLSLDTALSCGLIVNEVVTNSFKYAFPDSFVKDNDELKVEIKVNKIDSNKYLMIIRDNGVGLPKDFEIEKSDSLGMKLINSIVNQLNGNIEIKSEKGTEFKIVIEDLK